MPRIRTIKPEFWSDEKLSPLPDSVRLLFLGLIGMADDYGRVLDSPKQIEAFIWPHEDRSRDCREALATLARLSRIQRGATASGQAIIQITNWMKHQRVDKPSLKTALPPILAPSDTLSGPSPEAREALTTVSRSDLGPTTVDLGSSINDHGSDGIARQLAIAANQAITQRFGEQLRPMLASGGPAHQLACDVADAGIPTEFAASSIVRQVRDSLSAPPKTIKYFWPGIQADWDAQGARDDAAAAARVTPLPSAPSGSRRSRPSGVEMVLAQLAEGTQP